MSFQERIKKIDVYKPHITYKDQYIIIQIKFDKMWTIVCPDDERIGYQVDANNQHYFVSKIGDVDILFDLIDTIISVNQEKIKKNKLFEEKIKELKEIFLSDKTYDELLNLTFTFPNKVKKRTKQNKKVEKPSKALSSDIVNIESNSTETISDIDEKVNQILK